MMYEDRLRKTDWDVRTVDLKIAARLIEDHHYAKGCANTATYRHGLFLKGRLFDEDCAGAALWMPPTKSAALATYPSNWRGVLCLSRLVVVPKVPKNACSFLLAASMRMIDRTRWPCLVTYADEWQGHRGIIYKATNWTYAGKTKPQPIFVRNGRMVSRKAGPKTRTKDEMLALGCELIGASAKHKYTHIVE